ncbi:hypothetical protein [Synechococcus sp. PCC 6312]|uniref:hypothetical protein n=1 Tax=Synechococcus sp. (strain ATCC 27167 / PCC 6312) TaxID=195253 RepID=UPI00029EE9D9|nr:hypothetical protein [Synechococcus sp. PCC 6312]AFY60902.1 hypothetical protein Syn6312_1753 [Synechococcus sp. PCC 6312]
MELKVLSDIPAFGGMEFSTFRLKPGISETKLFEAVDQMVEGLYANEAGFLGHALLRGVDGIYVDVVFADSQSQAAELCAKWGTGPFAPDCLSYLEKIEEGSVNLQFFERIK